MKLNRSLFIAGEPCQVIDERVRLSLGTPGRGVFTIVKPNDPIKVNQLILFNIGYSHQQTMQRWFIGIVDSVVAVGGKRQKVTCRELSSALSFPLPLSLRHVTLRDVLSEINAIIGLNFATPDKDYSMTKIANFYNIGSGYQAMSLLGRLFNIPDFIWQQQGNSTIYVGSWDDSRWAEIGSMTIPEAVFDSHSASQSARLLAIPHLRPGMVVNGQRLTSIEFQKNHMVASWKG